MENCPICYRKKPGISLIRSDKDIRLEFLRVNLWEDYGKDFSFPIMYRCSISQSSFPITPVCYFPYASTLWRDQTRTSCWNSSVLLTPATWGSVCVVCCGEVWRGDAATEDCTEFSTDVCTPHTPDALCKFTRVRYIIYMCAHL